MINLTSTTFNPEITTFECTLIVGFVFIILITVGGNLLVLYAIMIKRKLRQSVTNCLIASLAAADLLLGAIVMPFAVVDMYRFMYSNRLPLDKQKEYVLWPFGQLWCDMWHAFDVLSSTASILNLCVISVERYIAISDPFNYPLRMTHKRCFLMIAIVWICSSCISFPAIAWWRHSESLSKLTNVEYNGVNKDNMCIFSSDSIYLFISSLISFHIPLIVMLFVYWKIYRVASSLITAFNTGRRVVYRKSLGGEVMILRVHRGGMLDKKNKPGINQNNDKLLSPNSTNEHLDNQENLRKINRVTFDTEYNEETNINKQFTLLCGCYKIVINRPEILKTVPVTSNTNMHNDENPTKHCLSELKKRIQKFTNEKRAAKTLGIVMGVFVLCWAPFFIYNTIKALYPFALTSQENIIFPIVTWLGYINSGINPLIYAYSMKDMRQVFATILCGICVTKKKSPLNKSISSSTLHVYNSKNKCDSKTKYYSASSHNKTLCKMKTINQHYDCNYGNNESINGNNDTPDEIMYN